MNEERIRVKVTETGQYLEVAVLNKRAERIQVVLGQGINNVRCDLTPTRNGLAYAGSVMGREIVYERSRAQVQAELDRIDAAMHKLKGR
ncbi:MAG TPA: hypothetical protein VFP70_15745 [Burkholderiales bacterium]|nr:hypothetical protein [Burkholderiales bacterium]